MKVARGIVVRMPQTWTGFAVGVIVGGLGVGWMCVAMCRLSTAHAGRAPAGLTAAEEGTLRAALADGQQTRQTAVAYFESMEGADRSAGAPGQIASAHRDEIDGVVADSIREHLVEALGAERAGQVESRVGSLAALERYGAGGQRSLVSASAASRARFPTAAAASPPGGAPRPAPPRRAGPRAGGGRRRPAAGWDRSWARSRWRRSGCDRRPARAVRDRLDLDLVLARARRRAVRQQVDSACDDASMRAPTSSKPFWMSPRFCDAKVPERPMRDSWPRSTSCPTPMT